MAACPRCGTSLTESAQFCSNCGSGIGFAPGSPKWPWIATLLGVFAILAIGIQVSGKLRAAGRQQEVSTLATGQRRESPGVLSAAATPPEPAVAADALRMPDDVRRWLEHLKAIDDRRAAYNEQASATLVQRVTSGILAAGVVETEEEATADEAKRQGVAKDITAETNRFFVKLAADFNAVPVPAECAEIAARYNEALAGTQTMIVAVFKAVEAVSLESLQNLRGQSLKRVDAPAAKCNESIAAICRKYREPNKYEVLVEKQSMLNVDGLLLGGGLSTAPPAPKDDGGG